MSDVTIKVGEKKFMCHRFQLTRHSDVFAKMFRDNLKEGQNREVEIKGFDEETVANFIQFMYCGTLEKSDEYTQELMHLACFYNVSELVKQCAKELKGTRKRLHSYNGKMCMECAWNFYPYDAEKDKHLSDFTIKVGDVQFPVHKLRLAQISDVFDKMFRGNDQLNELVIDDFNQETVSNYLEFSYQGKLENSREKWSWQKCDQALYRMSIKYWNESLESEVGEKMTDRLDDLEPKDMAELWDLAEKANNLVLLRGLWWYFALKWCKTPSKNFPGLDELLQHNPMYKHYFCQYMSEREDDMVSDIEYDTKEANKLEKRVAELEQQLDELR